MHSLLSLLVIVLPTLRIVEAAAFGYAAGTTGGGSATTQSPTSAAELVSWLEDTVTRRIVLKQMWDLTNLWGTETGEVCFPWSCSSNPQGMISTSNNFCASYSNKGTATWSAASGRYIKVKSNKSLIGTGANTGIKGAGLRFEGGVSNVIIQNVRFESFNPRWVWGGDFIQLDGSSKIWIDHCYFNRVGRQFIVSGFNANSYTVSNSIFDGTADYTTSCKGYHYWTLLLVGTGDKVTFANNYVYHVEARAPHVGGPGSKFHFYNNYFNDISGHTLESDDGNILFEGNYFNNVPTNSGSISGKAYWVSGSNAGTCGSSVGRTCQANTFANSGSATLQDSAVLSALGADTAVRGATVMAASAVPSYVAANAGTGKVIT